MKLSSFKNKERVVENLSVIGIDIAKNFIQIYGMDTKGKLILKKRLKRENFLTFMANVPKCLIGMEACGGAHYWAKQLKRLGFEVKLMSPRKVKKFVENNKNDEKDAKACGEAVQRADMRFVPIKNDSQLEMQALHRARSYYVRQRTGLSNRIRGLLLEIGMAIPQGKASLAKKMSLLLHEEESPLSPKMKLLFLGLWEDMHRLNLRVEEYSHQIEQLAKEDELCKRLQTIDGIGPITATALMAKIGNGSEFRKGRELSAFLGLVPKQNSSGETQRLGRITKHGDRYVRQLLIHGGRSSIQAALRKNKTTGLFEKQDSHSQWMRKLVERVGRNKASVAVANKNARMVVAVLKNKTPFKPILAHELIRERVAA